jgi:hypothetical protein
VQRLTGHGLRTAGHLEGHAARDVRVDQQHDIRVEHHDQGVKVAAAWTDDGASRETRGLKHPGPGETRSIPRTE